MPTKRAILAIMFSLSVAPIKAAPSEWTNLLDKVEPRRDAIAGSWTKSDAGLVTDATTSSRLQLPAPPAQEYDFRVQFTRTQGVHSIALFFVTPEGQATFEIDAWGENLAGIQHVNGQDLRQNATRQEGQRLTNGQRYTALIEVRKDRVRASVDGTVISELPLKDVRLSVLPLWRLRNANALGVGAYEAATTFHAVEVRRAESESVTSGVTKPSEEPSPRPGPNPPAVAERNGRRVLMVIANRDFFYREWADPKAELERAGFTVETAAAQKVESRPHPNSGQGDDGGVVMPDVALADVEVDRYEAIVFSGGWGSSIYQYAFPGTYANRYYNGDARTKATANRLINEFLTKGKHVGALCHGVSVLAWARVNGRSPLNGKRVAAPTVQGPAGVYNGQQAQPPSRWNAQANGARLTPPNSIGDPRTPADDVAIDGKIVTAQDDSTSRHFGRVFAEQLRAAR